MKLAFYDSNGTLYGYAADDSTARGEWQMAVALSAGTGLYWLVHRGWSMGLLSRSAVRRQHILQPGQERDLDGVRFVGMQRGNFLLAWTKLLSAERPDWWYWQGAQASWGAMLFIAKTIGVRSIF